jgi:hypothetical protein
VPRVVIDSTFAHDALNVQVESAQSVARAQAGGTKQGRSRRRKQPPPTSANERANPVFMRYSRPTATTSHAPGRVCKQEITGSIPVGSIFVGVRKLDAEDEREGFIDGLQLACIKTSC